MWMWAVHSNRDLSVLTNCNLLSRVWKYLFRDFETLVRCNEWLVNEEQTKKKETKKIFAQLFEPIYCENEWWAKRKEGEREREMLISCLWRNEISFNEIARKYYVYTVPYFHFVRRGWYLKTILYAYFTFLFVMISTNYIP